MRSCLVTALLLIPWTGVSQAQNRQACLQDEVGLNGPAKASFFSEFRSLAGPRGVNLSDSGCQPDAIRISLLRESGDKPEDVLGAAKIEGSGISGRLEVYFEPVVETIPAANCWTVIGRALARVAVHEVSHYLEQSQGHAQFGLMQPRFTGAQLASADPFPCR